jgi:hypothetical protein
LISYPVNAAVNNQGTLMSEDNQIIIPPSFIALFVPPGRNKPTASKAYIYERYDLCEDMANMLTEQASTKLWELGITEADVLERMERGLVDPQLGLTEGEVTWVIARLAELLGWGQA